MSILLKAGLLKKKPFKEVITPEKKSKGRPPKETREEVPDVNDVLVKIYSKRVDQMEKRFAITSQELHIPNKVSTDLLCIDLLLGGGIAAGAMYTVSGAEKGAKSSLSMTTFGQMIKKNVPVNLYWDAENSLSDPIYAKALMGYSPSDIFYGKNKRARLYQEAVLEDFYNSTKSVMRSLPDKLYRQDHKQWYFVFDTDKESRANMGDFGYSSYEKNLYQETGRLWCPTDMKGLQGFVVCDSYPALVISQVDEEEEKKTLPAQDARAFSMNIKKVRGVMKRKGFSIFGVNQIRTNPMPSYGQTSEYEPLGASLKFGSDCRLQNRPRSCPQEWFLGVKPDGGTTTQFGQEPSVVGKGFDKYHYIKVVNTKNKLGRPGLECMQRVWFNDGNNEPRGLDRAFDCFQYLQMTGRVDSGPKRPFKVDHPAIKDRKFTWDEFKLLVLAYTDPILMKRAKVKFENMKVIPDIRKDFFKEIRTRKVYEMLVDRGSKEAATDLEA